MKLTDYLDKGISFDIYYKQVEDHIENGDQNHQYYPYYGLNSVRMQRLVKVTELTEEEKARIEKIKEPLTFLIITEGWCGDASQIIPVVQKIAEASPVLNAKLVYRDENPELMDAYLTNGSQSIPIVIGVNENGEEVFRWGPRPEFGNALLQDFKEGKVDRERFSFLLQKAYNKDKGRSIIKEILDELT